MDLSTKQFVKHRWAIIALLVFILIQLAFSFRTHIFIWDEAVFLGMGKYIFSHGTVGLFEPFRPIILPIITGFLFWIGLPINVFELISILASSLTLWVTYLIGREINGEKTGVFAMIILFTHTTFFLWSGYVMNDILGTFFVLLAIYCNHKRFAVTSGICSALAFLTRWPNGIVILILGLAYAVEWKKNATRVNVKEGTVWFTLQQSELLRFIFGASLLILPFFIFNSIVYSSTGWTGFAYPILSARFAETSPGGISLEDMWHTVISGQWIILFALIGLFKFHQKFNTSKLGQLLLGYFLLTSTYYSFIPHHEARYTITFIPILAILAGFGIMKLFQTYPRTMIGIFILFSIPSIYAMYTLYMENGTEGTTIPTIVTNYYKNPEFSGTWMTTDPVPAAYTNARFIPLYYNPSDAIQTYETEHENVRGVLFTDSFSCESTNCFEKVRVLHEKIENDFTKTWQEEYLGRNYTMYKRK